MPAEVPVAFAISPRLGSDLVLGHRAAVGAREHRGLAGREPGPEAKRSKAKPGFGAKSSRRAPFSNDTPIGCWLEKQSALVAGPNQGM